MAKTVIDSASIHSALAALDMRRADSVSDWDRQCLTETTYLLLFQNAGIVPGPGHYRGASGLFQHVVSGLPALAAHKYSQAPALQATRRWLSRDRVKIGDAWNQLKSETTFGLWAHLQRRLFWIDHVRMHEALFNLEFLPHLAPMLGCSNKELERVQVLSTDERVVRRWQRKDSDSPEANLANDAWLLSAFFRGRFHEYVAQAAEHHLSGHPFRRPVQRTLKAPSGEHVLHSEEAFVRTLVGSALLETSPERRVQTWVAHVAKARQAISLGQIALPDTALESDAERHAASAARTIGVSTTYARIRRELDTAASLGIGGLLAVGVSPWLSIVAPFIPPMYRHWRGVGIGDDFSRAFLDTKRRFKALARKVPGRIERTIRMPKPT